MKNYLKKIPLRVVQMMTIVGLLVTALELNAQTYCTPTGSGSRYVSQFILTGANVDLKYLPDAGAAWVMWMQQERHL